MEKKTKVTVAIIGSILLGAIVYLIATKSGEKLKKKIKVKGKALLTEVNELINEAKEQCEISNPEI